VKRFCVEVRSFAERCGHGLTEKMIADAMAGRIGEPSGDGHTSITSRLGHTGRMGFILFGLFAVGGLFISSTVFEGLKKSWSDAAARLGLEINPGGRFTAPTIRGRIADVSVEISTFSGNKKRYTQYRITHPPDGPPVKIKRQRGLHRFARFVGGNDVEVGDPRFDEQVIVDSAHRDQVRAFLTPSRQAAILALFSGRQHTAELTHDTIRITTAGYQGDADKIVETVNWLVSIAQVMGHPAEVDAALALQQQGELGSAIEELHDINEHNPNIFTQMLEAEALVEHGEHERASQIMAPVLDAGPPEANGWKQVADGPAPVLLPAPSHTEPQPSGLRQQAVIDDLFGGTHMSFEVVERFESEYVNQRVAWSGTVTQAHTYRHDNDFGEGPGQKVTVLLGSSGTGSLISNEVHAVLQLGSHESADPGRSVSFEGTLLHVDRFARKLYVARGTLI